MSRIETVEHKCDWCGVRAPGGAFGSPAGWRFVDSLDFEDDICPACAEAAKTLLAGAKAARAAGIPATPVGAVEVKGVANPDRKHEGDHECG